MKGKSMKGRVDGKVKKQEKDMCKEKLKTNHVQYHVEYDFGKLRI
jgi:hypothetical protein